MSTVCHPILSNVSGSRLHQRKPANNVKYVSVHVSPVYVSSVSELVGPLNVCKAVCSSNANKCNVCNASITSQLIKTLNLSKRGFSNNATKRSVCKTNSVSQLVEPLNVSKTVCSNNATERIVCKVSSVCQLVKLSDVSKPVCSNNVTESIALNASNVGQLVKIFDTTKFVCSSIASNSAIFNSTFKSVSDFVSNCQSVETVFKLTDMNQKRPHERIANGKSAINILMMSIYFHTFLYFLCFLITMLIIFSKATLGVIIFLVMSF